MGISINLKNKKQSTQRLKTKINQLTIKITMINKRIFDIIASLIGLLLLAPIFVIIGLLIQRDSPGPVFFRCNRMGKGGKPFKMLKFRTMYEDLKSYQGPPVTCEGDDRITPFGGWLRDTKINELPQLWNVLIGEMSLVGPRPEDVDIASDWPKDVFAEVLSVKPGITSPASILYHDEENLLSKENVMEKYLQEILPDKIRLDRLYVRNHSFTADLDTIFWTIAILLPRISHLKIPEGYLFFGPISRLIYQHINWFIIDLIISIFVVVFVGFLWRLQAPLNWGIESLAIFALVLALLFSGVNSLTGLRKILWSRATTNDGMNLLLANSLVTLFLIGINSLDSIFDWMEIPPLPILMILSIGLLTAIGFIFVRFRLRVFTSIASRWINLRRRSVGVGERVIIVGTEKGFDTAIWQLRQKEFHPIFSIVGAVDNNPNILGMYVNDCQILGNISNLPELIEKYDVGVIIFTDLELDKRIKKLIDSISKNKDLRIVFVNEMTEVLIKQISQSADFSNKLLWSADRLKFLVTHDAITGLPNQYLFNEHLRHSLAFSNRNNTITIILIISFLDNNKYLESINQKDSSEILRQITFRLLKSRRECDTLAYLENWEFGLILNNILAERNTYLIAKRIHSLFTTPICANEEKFILNPQISCCGDCESIQQLQFDDEFEFEQIFWKLQKEVIV